MNMRICDEEIKIQGRLLRVASLDGDQYNFPEDPEVIIGGLRKCGRRVDLFTFLQRLPESKPHYLYPMELDNLAALPVSSFEQWWTTQIGFKARNKAKQSEKKGVTFREMPFGDDLVRGVCEIYNETPIRQGKRFPHYGMTLERGRDYAGTFLDRSIYIGAFFGDRMIGFVKLAHDKTKTQADLVHILSMVQHRDKAPTNALIAEAVRACAARGISYLVYDKFAYGNKQGDSLSQFKEASGFRRFDLPRYYVPLTLIGRAALQFGMHHRLIDRLPEPMLAKLRQLRKAWYERRFQTATP
jgi:hypothetical protein